MDFCYPSRLGKGSPCRNATCAFCRVGRFAQRRANAPTWRGRSTQGVSHWLFAGQLAASTGFVIYSVLQGDWVFVVSNVFLLFTALLG